MGGRLIASTSQKGGAGKTTLATKMACVVARELQQDVALVQLERPFAGDDRLVEAQRTRDRIGQ